MKDSDKNKLFSKVESEYKQYCNDLLYSSAEQIILRSYETAIKRQLVDALIPGCDLNILDSASISFLLNQDNALSYLYDDYLDCEFGLDINIKEFFDEINKNLSIENEL